MSALIDIGTSLVQRRRAAGVSQRELAERLETSQQQIARWEASAYRTASLERVAAAADALGLAPAVLPLATESAAVYGPASAHTTTSVAPVRDLGDIAARLRANYLELRDTHKLERIGVFGSFASGEQTPESDVDLLIEVRDGESLPWLGAGAVNFIEGILGRKVDLADPQLLKDRIRPKILREVIYVWEA